MHGVLHERLQMRDLVRAREEQQLAESLRRIYGRQVSVQVTIDPRVLGGLSVQVGHDLYDGTVLHRLSQARNALTGRS